MLYYWRWLKNSLPLDELESFLQQILIALYLVVSLLSETPCVTSSTFDNQGSPV
jgi:hypothetical protein